jgi:hypothetical protein
MAARGARAAAPAMPVVGFLSSRSADDSAGVVAAFRQGLGEAGCVEGQNVVIHWADGQYNRLPGWRQIWLAVRWPTAVISVDLQPERFDDRCPESNVGCEGPPEFFRI